MGCWFGVGGINDIFFISSIPEQKYNATFLFQLVKVLRYALLSVGLDYWFGGRMGNLDNRKQKNVQHSSFCRNRTQHRSWLSQWAGKGWRVYEFVLVFFKHLCKGVCVGFESGNGSVVRYEVSSAQFGCKREKKNKTDWGLCGLHSAYAPYVCILNTQ